MAEIRPNNSKQAPKMLIAEKMMAVKLQNLAKSGRKECGYNFNNLLGMPYYCLVFLRFVCVEWSKNI
jgi:hypothetical protein